MIKNILPVLLGGIVIMGGFFGISNADVPFIPVPDYEDCQRDSKNSYVAITCIKNSENSVNVRVSVKEFLPDAGDSKEQAFPFLFYKKGTDSIKYEPLVSFENGMTELDTLGFVDIDNVLETETFMSAVYLIDLTAPDDTGRFVVNHIDEDKVQSIIKESEISCHNPDGVDGEEEVFSLKDEENETITLVCENDLWKQKISNDFKIMVPRNLRYEKMGDNKVLIEWDALEEKLEFEYLIFKDSVLLGKTSNTSIEDSEIELDVPYRYSVSAQYEDMVSVPSDEILVILKGLDHSFYGPPANLVVEELSKNQVKLTWDEATEAESFDYEVYRDGDLLATTQTLVFVDGTVSAGNTYKYKIVAKDGETIAGETSEVLVTLESDDSTGAGGGGSNNTDFPLEIDVLGGDINDFERVSDGIRTTEWQKGTATYDINLPAGNYTFSFLVHAPDVSYNSLYFETDDISQQTVHFNRNYTEDTWQTYDAVFKVDSPQDQLIIRGREYNFTLKKIIINQTNLSERSVSPTASLGDPNSVLETSLSGSGTGGTDGGSTTTIGNARSVVSRNVESSSVQIGWTAPSEGMAEEYEIYRNSFKIGETSGLFFNDTDLNANTSYIYYIIAVSDDGTKSSKSGEVLVQTKPLSSGGGSSTGGTTGGPDWSVKTTSAVPTSAELEDLPLRDIVEHQNFPRNNFWIGYMVKGSSGGIDSSELPTAVREYNLATPEYIQKANANQQAVNSSPNEAAFNRHVSTIGDRMDIHGHTLIWYTSNPGWINSATSPQAYEIMEDRVLTMLRNGRGNVEVWDVVNEAIRDYSGAGWGVGDPITQTHINSFVGGDMDALFRGDNWPRSIAPGQNYVKEVFKIARAEVDTWPKNERPQLIYNDYDVLWKGVKSDAMYELVKDLVEDDLIDGVGFQSHLWDDFKTTESWDVLRVGYKHTHSDTSLKSHETVPYNLQRFADLDLDIYITEMDVRLRSFENHGRTVMQASDHASQKDLYKTVLAYCLDQPRCRGFQAWGSADHQSWFNWMSYHNNQLALPFDRNFNPKPAYYGLKEALIDFATDSSNHNTSNSGDGNSTEGGNENSTLELLPPSNLSVQTSNSTSVTLDWDESSSGEVSSYEVYKNNTLVADDISNTQYTDSGLIPNSNYSYHIVAVGSDGFKSSKSESVNARTSQTSTPPTPVDNNSVLPSGTDWSLEWNDEFDGSAGSKPAVHWNFGGWSREGERHTDTHAFLNGDGKLVMRALVNNGTPEMSYLQTFPSAGNDWAGFSQIDNPDSEKSYILDPKPGPLYIETSVRFDEAHQSEGVWWAFWLFAPDNYNNATGGKWTPNVAAYDPYDGIADNGMEVDIWEYAPDLTNVNGGNMAVYTQNYGLNVPSGACKTNWTKDFGRIAEWPTHNCYGFIHDVNGYLEGRGYSNPGINLIDGDYHKIGLYWDLTKYEFYLDGYKMWEVTNPHFITKDKGNAIMLTWEKTNGLWTATPNPGPDRRFEDLNTEVRTYVDHVRVYRGD